MVVYKKINSIDELQSLYRKSLSIPETIGMHSLDNTIMADIKSFLGVMNLDYNKPVKIVTESEKYINSIFDVGENIKAEDIE